MHKPWPSADAEKTALVARVQAGNDSVGGSCGSMSIAKSVAQFAVEWNSQTGQPDALFFFASAGRPQGVGIALEPGEGSLLGAVLRRSEASASIAIKLADPDPQPSANGLDPQGAGDAA